MGDRLVVIALRKCSRCGFYTTPDEFHADNNWRDDKMDVWCKGCKRNSKIQAKYLKTAGRVEYEERIIHVPILAIEAAKAVE